MWRENSEWRLPGTKGFTSGNQFPKLITYMCYYLWSPSSIFLFFILFLLTVFSPFTSPGAPHILVISLTFLIILRIYSIFIGFLCSLMFIFDSYDSWSQTLISVNFISFHLFSDLHYPAIQQSMPGILAGTITIVSLSTSMFLGGEKKLVNPEETHTDMWRPCKIPHSQ